MSAAASNNGGAAATAVVEGDTSYRNHPALNSTQYYDAICVHEPKSISNVMKALRQHSRLFVGGGGANVLDITSPHVVSLHPSVASGDAFEKLKASKARVVVTATQRQPNTKNGDDNNNNNNETAPTVPTSFDSTLASLLATALLPSTNSNNNSEQQQQQQQQQVIQQALASLATPAIVKVQTTYKNFSAVEILSRLLPSGVVVPSGFECVGHIAHLNLQKCHEPHKKTIAQVLLDTHPGHIRTVVNKTEAISSEFRELPFELLAGEADFTAVVKQHGVEFRVPYDKVYWNSRLSQEHTRLVGDAMQPGDELLDVMAGVGPFAVPAAICGVRVFANDLNPAAAEAMRVNAKLNKVPTHMFDVFNLDGRAFVAEMREKRLRTGQLSMSSAAATATATAAKFRQRTLRHFVMNLPATAVLFLDAFVGPAWPAPVRSLEELESTAAASSPSFDHTFVVHVYCFSSFGDPATAQRDAVKQVAQVLGKTVGDASQQQQTQDASLSSSSPLSVLVHRVHVVRDVAPNKLMVCVSFSPQIVAPMDQHAALRAAIKCFKVEESAAAAAQADDNVTSAPARRDRK